MPITDPLRLPADVILAPVSELPIDLRKRIACDEGDYALTRPRARTPSRIINRSTAELLREFASPSTLARAIVRFARARGTSPETTLEAAYPVLELLFAAGFLVSDADDAQPIDYQLNRGELVGTWEVLAPIQVLHDTEVYQARSGGRIGILKIERRLADGRFNAATMLRREATTLKALDGSVAPRLMENGDHEGRCFLAIEWCPGLEADAYADELREEADRAEILAFCVNIVAAYAQLHDRGFVHGDVHPSNILVDPSGNVRLIDFGHATPIGKSGAPPRAGMSFFFEPEFAAAALGGSEPPAASPAGEQYAVAALLYLLSTGRYYLDFSIERGALLRQIVAEKPRLFSGHAIAPWPGLERVLARALSKSPQDRYPSMGAMQTALAGARVEVPGWSTSRPSPVAPRFLERTCAELGIGGIIKMSDLSAPRVSVFSGAGGIACAFYRLALLCDSASHLAAADMWLALAEDNADYPEAFSDPMNGSATEHAGSVGPLHTASGLAAMRALIANAQGDFFGSREATKRFTVLALESMGSEKRDLAVASSGALLAAALVGDVLPDDAVERHELAGAGGRMVDVLWNELDASPPLGRHRPNLGMAHGWGGHVYATLRFCGTFGNPLPQRTYERLSELAGLAEPWQRGVRWRWNERGGDVGTLQGWCNGSAGFVQLFTRAHREFEEQRFLDLAVGAAWDAWDGDEGDGTLCCGEAGRAYALLTLGRHLGGDTRWLTRAKKLCERAVAAIDGSSEKPYSLFRGGIGAALLLADVERPAVAAFPFLEDEGWR
jgi:serine/threonine protein kinase